MAAAIRLGSSQHEYIHSAHSWTYGTGGRLAGCVGQLDTQLSDIELVLAASEA